ncbi:MAG: hypothetical protein M1814_002454 [Vezdaea aestivalis]|nr:MAG: hypothetical protein M1814_002454 [Vezdaea aestivalis]
MAEAIALVGFVSAITQLIDLSTRICDRLNEFQNLKIRLPLLKETLRQTQLQVQKEALEESVNGSITEVVEGCQTQIELLNTILVKALPEKNDSKFRRVIKAFSSVQQEKTVQKILDRIHGYQMTLTHYHTTITSMRTNIERQTLNSISNQVRKDASGELVRDVRIHVPESEFGPKKDYSFAPDTTIQQVKDRLKPNANTSICKRDGTPISLSMSTENCVLITSDSLSHSTQMIDQDETFISYFNKLKPLEDLKVKGINLESTDSSHLLIDGVLNISLHRTVRLPNCDVTHGQTPSLGHFPMFASQDFGSKVPVDMREKGGLIVPMWQGEAMMLGFSTSDTTSTYAIRVFVGGVNAISGHSMEPNMNTVLRKLKGSEKKQDYIVVGGQQDCCSWLSGIAVAPGIIRQFVTLPLTSRDTIEFQKSGINDVGGLQIEIIPQYRRGSHTISLFPDHSKRTILKDNLELSTPKAMGYEPGSAFYIPCDPRPRTILDELMESSETTSRTVELHIKKSEDGDKRRWTTKDLDLENVWDQFDHYRVGRAEGPTLTIQVVGSHQEVFFTLNPDTPLKQVMSIFCKRAKVHPASVRFIFDNSSRVRSYNTPSELDMQDGDWLEVKREQIGGGYSGPRWNFSKWDCPNQGFGAGAKVHQNVQKDTQDPRLWNLRAAKLLNFSTINSEVFTAIAGAPPLTPPPSFDTYQPLQIPYPDEFKEETSSIRGIFTGIVPTDEPCGGDDKSSSIESGSTSEVASEHMCCHHCSECGWPTHELFKCKLSSMCERTNLCKRCMEEYSHDWFDREKSPVTNKKVVDNIVLLDTTDIDSLPEFISSNPVDGFTEIITKAKDLKV